jgi:hypothetical protein
VIIERSHSLAGVSLCKLSLRLIKHDLAQRAVANLVFNADAMIRKFIDAFRDLKIELILGFSLQTTIVSCHILQKVENIGE